VIVLGIDPGTRHLGWGVVRADGNRIRHVAHGVIDAHGSLPLAERLEILDAALAQVITTHSPAVGSVETLFFHRDPQAASKLGHARGVVLLCLARAKVTVAEYAPAHVKRVITGKGNADKRQVAHMIRTLLALDEPPKSDAADALALAVAHARRAPIESAIDARRTTSAIEPALLALLTRGKRGRRPSVRIRPAVR
jgi:crossover junction endodeoxyribonuclease RuvC